MSSEQQTYDATRDGARLSYFGGGPVPFNEKITEDLVILVHGFTSEGGYLRVLADLLKAEQLKCARFDYASHYGVEAGGKTLAEHMRLRLENNPTLKMALVGHSMGGLVARYGASLLTSVQRKSITAIVLLGTPNKGFAHRFTLLRVFDLADSVSNLNPYLRLRACPASRQLLLKDENESLLRKLTSAERKCTVTIPMLSISGGQSFIEPFSKPHPFLDGMINAGIQKGLKKPNDGLVHEANADITNFAPRSQGPKHFNDYSEYSQTNHAGLVKGQILAGYIAKFLDDHGLARTRISPPLSSHATTSIP
jgi:pimeloyl-ACP methyl ester carboxylesterase